eukprot:TRINITY_DN3779_c0_g1_i1.p1 TRINITY_DN3779_c0_g1~~TRINITY_DN3779_c0_g1_i1.p1  ORF type:complete len:1214 (-),score=376.16 TRINITY_DN3779_c0_g1_i1:27-3668(-)
MASRGGRGKRKSSDTSEASQSGVTITPENLDGAPVLKEGIQRLEISNFKSYKKEVVGPFLPFTSIIGPNGSGKSNIMDAISFVLGVKTGTLRGSNLKDLINSDAKKQGEGAYVKLFFKRIDETIVEFRHSIKPNGDPEYRYEGRVVSVEEYKRHLEELGFNLKSRNFLVFQGDIESLASKSPKDLTALLEQLSGSDQLKEGYDQALIEKEKAEEETFFIYQKKKGLNSEKKQFKEQKDEAEAFQKLQKDVENTKREHALFQFYYMEQELKKTIQEMEEQRAQLDSLQSDQQKQEETLAAHKKEQAKHHRTYLSREKELKDLQNKLSQNKPKAIELKEQLAHIRRRIATSTTTQQKIQEEHDQQQNELQVLRRTLEEVRRAAKDFAAEMEKREEKAIKLTAAQLKEYGEIKERVVKETLPTMEELEKLRRQQNADTEDHDTIIAKIKELEERKKQQQENEGNNKERQQKLTEWIREARELVDHCKAKLAEAKAKQKKILARRNELTQLLEEIDNNLQEAKVDKSESDREAKNIDRIESLKRLFSGVHGRLVDLCKPIQKKYNVALTVATGRNMDAIIVDNNQTAQECVTYLKEQRLGIATFLPLESISTKPINERLRQLPGTAKLVVDVVKADPAYQKALLYACGNTIVCDTLEEARRLAFRGNSRHKVVTIDGVLIRKSGLMTGGAGNMDTRASKWNLKAVEEMKKRRDKYLNEMEELIKEMRSTQERDYASEIAGHEESLKYYQIDLDNTNEKISGNQKEIKKIDSELAKLEPIARRLSATIKERTNELEDLDKRKREVEDAAFRSFTSRVGIPNIREYEAERLKRQQERSEKEIDFKNQISRLENQIEYESHRNLQEPLQRIRSSIEEDEKKYSDIEKQEAKLQKQNEKLQDSFDTTKKHTDEAKKVVEDKEKEIKDLKRQLHTLIQQIASIHKQITAKETQVDQIRTRRHNLLQTCKVQEIKVTVKEQRERRKRKRGEKEEESEGEESDPMELEEPSQAVQEREDEIDIDYTDLPASRKKLSLGQYEVVNNEYYDKIQNKQTSLDKMAPNMKAIHRFDDVMKRLETINADFEKARTNAKDAAKKFTDVKTKRYELFTKAFEKISKSVDHVYGTLTQRKSRSDGQIVHGTAYLTLENQDEPYNGGIKYYAMPPTQRFVEIEALSGGEKTIAALSLLFAFHTFKRAPFFVLDELDVALDGNCLLYTSPSPRD